MRYRLLLHSRDGKETETIDFLESIKIDNEFNVYDVDMGYVGNMEIVKVEDEGEENER